MVSQDVIIVEDMPHTRRYDVSKTGLRSLMDAGSKAVEPEVGRKVAIIEFLPERIHTREKGCHSVRKFSGLHRA
jgi:hypothetical protein